VFGICGLAGGRSWGRDHSRNDYESTEVGDGVERMRSESVEGLVVTLAHGII
jgi:hypothetical protein